MSMRCSGGGGSRISGVCTSGEPEEAAAAAKAAKEREAKRKLAVKAAEASRKAKEKAAHEAKRQREIEAKRKAIETERANRLREIERRNEEERKRQERREAEERKRQEALDKKRHSRPYGDKPDFLEELRLLLIEERDRSIEEIKGLDAVAEEMLVDRERLEYDDDDGSGAASDMERDQMKEQALKIRLKVDEIEVALTRVADGSYGRCDECYDKIPKERLVYQKPVFTCVNCRSFV